MSAVPPRDDEAALAGVAGSRVWQALAVAAATIFVGSLHWQNDGLWFQGDAPRHAANGLFFWDLLAALPTDPLGFTLSYYARYPVIAPVVYPPLFYVLEGIAFRAAGPSPYVAKVLVLSFAGMAGFYAMAWARRWIAPLAGWAGACVVLLPGIVRYSNAVLLNVPAMALGLGALYHLHAWLETSTPRERVLFIGLTTASVLTYYPAAIIFPVGAVWVWLSAGRRGARLPALLAAVLSIIVLTVATALPMHLARHAPSLTRGLSPSNWLFYVRELTNLTGATWVVLAGAGLPWAFLAGHRRQEAARLAVSYVCVIGCLVLLPAMSDRYALVLAPITVLAACLGIVTCAEKAGRWKPAIGAASMVLVVMLSVRAAVTASVPNVSGIQEVAAYLRLHAPGDAVLYSGRHDGVFGFYVRALDPSFERRLVLSSKLLSEYRQGADFYWIETPNAASTADVVSRIQHLSGCKWVAVEIGPVSWLPATELLLRRALEGPEFERVRSFRVTAEAVVRVDLYRVAVPVEPAPPMDLSFPSFSRRVFRAVDPIERRR